MWALDQISIEMVEAERQILHVRISTPVGAIELVGELQQIDRTLLVQRVHVQGLNAGRLGRSGLNAIGRKMLVDADGDETVIEGSSRSTGLTRGRPPRPIRFPH